MSLITSIHIDVLYLQLSTQTGGLCTLHLDYNLTSTETEGLCTIEILLII